MKIPFTIGTTPQVILGSGNREIIAITNYSTTADVFVSFDGDTTVTDGNGAAPGILIPPRSTWTLGNTYPELRINNLNVCVVASSAGTKIGLCYW